MYKTGINNNERLEVDKRGLKIMIVEDEFIFALDTKNTLLQMGYEVTGITSNYYDTVKYVQCNKPDLMLMDINIKGDINGIDTAKYLLEAFNIPSLFLTAYSDNKTREKVSLVRSVGILIKPLDDIQFREIMQNFELKLHLQ